MSAIKISGTIINAKSLLIPPPYGIGISEKVIISYVVDNSNN